MWDDGAMRYLLPYRIHKKSKYVNGVPANINVPHTELYYISTSPVEITTGAHQLYLTRMPGCCGVVIGHDMLLPYEGGKHHHVAEMLDFLECAASELGYTIMLTTWVTPNQNDTINEVRPRKNWTEVKEAYFNNRRTMHNVCTFVCKLYPAKRRTL